MSRDLGVEWPFLPSVSPRSHRYRYVKFYAVFSLGVDCVVYYFSYLPCLFKCMFLYRWLIFVQVEYS